MKLFILSYLWLAAAQVGGFCLLLMKEYKPNMLKAIIVGAMIVFAGASAPTAHAGQFCDALGDSPTVKQAEDVLWVTIFSAVKSKANPESVGRQFAEDVMENCPQNYSVVSQASENISNQLGG